MLTAVTNRIKVFYNLIQCSVVHGYQRADRFLCLFRLGKTLLVWTRNQLKHWYPFKLHVSQRTIALKIKLVRQILISTTYQI